MRYLGIDFGSKRVGVAVSDESNSFAFPVTVLANSERLVEEIQKLCVEHRAAEIVVGESRDFSQVDNDIMKEIRPFVKKMEELGFVVHMHPEFMSSLEAKQLQGKNTMTDASAAAIILKSYLDTHNDHN